MNLIYSCVFVNEKYLILLEKLLSGYYQFNQDNDNMCYLVITNENFKERVTKICQDIGLNHDIWIMDTCQNESINHNIYESTYARYNIFNYPKISDYEKILYLDCDILIRANLQPIFNLEISENFYLIHEPCHRFTHCALFSDEEFNELDHKLTFTTAIIFFKNNENTQKQMNQAHHFVEQIHKEYEEPLPAYDQPIVNRFFIDEKNYDNQLLTKYCVNILGNDGIEKISQIPNYLLCHFATRVGDDENKLERINIVNKFMPVQVQQY